MAVIVPVAAKFDDRGIKQAKSAFTGLASSLKGIIGTLGVATSFAGLAKGLQDASKAAVGDIKSQALLERQLRNTIGASDAQVASVEASISAMELQASVADDQIRPAFAQLVRATKDVEIATKLTQLALDVSAGTGRDLGAVSIALSKAYQGNTTALSRLGIKAKEGVNIFDQLQTEFGGAAQTAANNDPYQQLETIFGRLQEQVGMALLPSLQNFSSWLSDPGTQGAIQFLIDKFNEFVASLQNVVDGANYVGQALSNVLNIDTGFATKAWNGFFSGLQESALKILFGPAYPLFKFLGIVGGAAPKAPKSTFTPTTFTPVDFTPVTKGSTSSTKKTKAQIAAEKAKAAYDKAVADLKKFKTDLKGMVDFTDLTKMSVELGQFEQSVVDTFDGINKKIAEGIANKTIGTKGLAELRKTLTSYNALLLENARQRDAIIKKRSLAEALINDVKSALTGTGNLASLLDTQSRQITTSVTKIVNGFTITTKQTVEEVIGAKGVVGRLKEVVAKTKAFATQLTDLKKAGLSPDLFKQIVEAGPDVGGQLATEILSGGADSVKALNDTFAELETVSASVAEQTAVVMYNNGVEVAGGLVNGLLSQEQALIDAAKTLADAFNAAYQANIMALAIPEAPAVAPKVSSKTTNVTNNIKVKATQNTKKTAQDTVALINKYTVPNNFTGKSYRGLLK